MYAASNGTLSTNGVAATNGFMIPLTPEQLSQMPSRRSSFDLRRDTDNANADVTAGMLPLVLNDP